MTFSAADPLPQTNRPRWRARLRPLLARCRRAPGRARVPRSTIALLAMSIALPIALFALAAAQNRRDVLRGAEHHVERTTRILHEHALKIFETQQLMLDQVNERLRTLDWANPRDVSALHELLDHLRRLLPQVVDIMVTDAAGHVRAGSRQTAPDPSLDLSDRDYFKALKASNRETPFVSRAMVGRQTGLPVFNIATRVRNPNTSRFDGVISIALDQAYFGDFYRDIEQGYTQIVVLARDDGSVLASDPPMEDPMLPAVALARLRADDGMDRAVIHPSVVDGKMRILGYEKVGTYPVLIGFGVTRHSALAPWRRNMHGYGLVAMLSSLVLLGVSGFAIRRIKLEGNATAKWRHSAALLEKEMGERSRIEDQLRQSQKMEAVGQLTGGIAHDFNNLLTVVIGNLDLLSRRMGDADPKHRSLIRNAIEGANRAASLTSRLLSFSRQQALAPATLDANALITGMRELLGRTLGEAVSIELRLADALGSAFADPNQLENAILNLCVNAVDAMPRGGQLTLATENVVLDAAFCARQAGLAPGRYVAIAVTDTGTGMGTEVIKRAFEPFFTTKPVGKGTGLGLSQLYGFARQSGGHADIVSQVGAGTTVRIYLPRVGDERAETDPVVATAAAEPVHARVAGTTVLIVEDDELVRHLGAGALRDSGYRVIEAATGIEGLRLVQAHPEIALLFTDVVLKGQMNGRELAQRAGLLRPSLPVLFTTGYTKAGAASLAEGEGADDGLNLIGKPFTTAALAARIAELLAAAPQRLEHSAVA